MKDRADKGRVRGEPPYSVYERALKAVDEAEAEPPFSTHNDNPMSMKGTE